MQLFSIAQIENNTNSLLVTITNDNGSKDLKVSKAKFKSYLERHCLLTTAIQMHDDEESTETVFATLSFDEYFNHCNVSRDLYNYILISNMENSSFDPFSSVKSILADYAQTA